MGLDTGSNLRWLSRASALLLNNVHEQGFARLLRRLIQDQVAFSSMQIVIYPKQDKALTLFDRSFGDKHKVDEFCFHCNLAADAKLRMCLGRNQQLGMFTAEERQFIADVSMIFSSLLVQYGDYQLQCGQQPPEIEPQSLEIQVQTYSSSKQELTPLTQREAQVTAMVLKGHTSISVGLVLGIATETVKIHRKRIYKKLQVGTQAELFARLSHLLAA